MAPKAEKQESNEPDAVKVLEEGHLFFFYRPKVEQESPESIDDLQRLYLVMRPVGGSDVGPQGEEAVEDEGDEKELKQSKEEHLKRNEEAQQIKPGDKAKQEQEEGATAKKDGPHGHANEEQATGGNEKASKKPKTEGKDEGDQTDGGTIGGKPLHEKDLKLRLRYVVVAKKALPKVTGKKSRPFWAFVETVTDDPEVIRQKLAGSTYETKTRGTRHQPAARPCGEGVYKITTHHAREHTHLAYKLELPRTPGEVQEELNILPEASFIIQVKNPDTPSPPNVGLGNRLKPDFPENLKRVFHGRRFVPADPPDLLDYPGCEFILISATDDVEEELGIEIPKEHENLECSDLVRTLKLDQELEKVRKPLLEGEWA